jgi:NAD(P)-dependent dehydrogenase (short-subunit alcohol dehydrogenase family)
VPGYTGYCASKTGLFGLVRAMAMEVAAENVQCNAVAPGWVETEMAKDGIRGMAAGMGLTYEAAYAAAMEAVPMGRMSQPRHIAGLVAWLLSEDGAGVTGQGIDMNNGAWMG